MKTPKYLTDILNVGYKDVNLSLYKFTINGKGTWELKFPNDEMAIYHGKKNHADIVEIHGVTIAGTVLIGNGIKIFKKF